MNTSVYIYALASNFCFALGSQFFTHYSRTISSVWMNAYKASLACVLFIATVFLTLDITPIEPLGIALFAVSGFMGLGLGDIFLLKAFADLGPGRTLILFGFQPLLLGLFGKLFLGQPIDTTKLAAIACFIAIVLLFAHESWRRDRSFGLMALTIAMTGIVLDAAGVVITRHVFDSYPSVHALEGNMYRCLGAVLFFLLLSMFRPFHFWKRLSTLSWKSRGYVSTGAILGTFLSLGFFLKAVQTGHLASVSGVAITGTLFSSAFECIWHKRWPSMTLWAALGLFLLGSWILLG
tara:strand:+ start:12428 stop:13306 length:879 start_codon:yes stop_codon:yes gene_type:complete